MSAYEQYHRYLCGCTEENGTAFPCPTHATPHSMHSTPAPGCESCENLLDEAREIAGEEWFIG